MNEEKQTAVMTPVFEGTRYMHHICSECGGTLEFKQSCYGGVFFYAISGTECKGMKFCPLCGAEIIRFSDKPIYESPIDLAPLDIFRNLHSEYERKARWLYHCYISDSHREKIDALIPLIRKGEISAKYLRALELAKEGRFMYTKNSRVFRKLREEFGEEKEAEQ